jgi:hypothetical protein
MTDASLRFAPLVAGYGARVAPGFAALIPGYARPGYGMYCPPFTSITCPVT